MPDDEARADREEHALESEHEAPASGADLADQIPADPTDLRVLAEADVPVFAQDVPVSAQEARGSTAAQAPNAENPTAAEPTPSGQPAAAAAQATVLDDEGTLVAAGPEEHTAETPAVRTRRGGRHGRRERIHPLLRTVMVAVVVVGIAAAAAVVEWPRPTFGESPEALASVSLPSFAGTITSVEVRSAQGGNVPVRSEGGLLQPSQQLAQGELLTVAITVARPQWIGWLVGRTTTSHFSVTTPIARVSNRWIEVSSGESPRVIFDQPIRVVKLGNAPQEVLGSSLSIVSVGVVAGGDDSAGQIDVEAAPRTWERLSAPIRVTWFQADPRPQLMPDPEATTADPTLGPEQSLTLTFSRPVQQVFGASLPRLVPKTAGSWQLTDSHTLTFRPAGGGYPVGGTVRVDLPARVSLSGRKLGTLVKSLRWQVKPASTLRLQQLFAALGYIPLVWQPSGSAVASSVAAQVAAAVSPPAGQFAWRYSTTPRELRALWHPGVVDQITLAAIMAFEDTHHMPADGHAGPVVWSVLIHDAIAGVQHPGGYTYVFVHSSVPQSLNLWHDGRVIITSPGNTGVPAAPTKLGTFQVFEHIPVGTMSGVNPDGTTYNDPGIRWISYFNHGEAIHSFNRSSFGTPQSLGCVELPLAAAAKVWPYTPIGTLVTIEK